MLLYNLMISTWSFGKMETLALDTLAPYLFGRIHYTG